MWPLGIYAIDNCIFREVSVGKIPLEFYSMLTGLSGAVWRTVNISMCLITRSTVHSAAQMRTALMGCRHPHFVVPAWWLSAWDSFQSMLVFSVHGFFYVCFHYLWLHNKCLQHLVPQSNKKLIIITGFAGQKFRSSSTPSLQWFGLRVCIQISWSWSWTSRDQSSWGLAGISLM